MVSIASIIVNFCYTNPKVQMASVQGSLGQFSMKKISFFAFEVHILELLITTWYLKVWEYILWSITLSHYGRLVNDLDHGYKGETNLEGLVFTETTKPRFTNTGNWKQIFLQEAMGWPSQKRAFEINSWYNWHISNVITGNRALAWLISCY